MHADVFWNLTIQIVDRTEHLLRMDVIDVAPCHGRLNVDAATVRPRDQEVWLGAPS